MEKWNIYEYGVFILGILIIITIFASFIIAASYSINQDKITNNQQSWCSEFCGKPENTEIIEHNQTKYCACFFRGYLFKNAALSDNNNFWLDYNITK